MNTAHVYVFVLISILRGQPRTPPCGGNLGVLDYHLKKKKKKRSRRSLTTTRPQFSFKLSIGPQVIVKSVKIADDTFKRKVNGLK